MSALNSKMKNNVKQLLWLLLLWAGSAGAQDTLVLRNNTRVVCTVTKIYPERIEYLNFRDTTQKQFYSYRKSDVVMIRYAGGNTDTILKQAAVLMSDSTSAYAENQYEQGLDDGLDRYRPSEERRAGIAAGIGSFIFPASIAVPIVYSVSKVQPPKIQDAKFIVSKNESYRRGYVDGASKRRVRAVWSSYGITIGSSVAGVVAILYLAGF